MAQASLSTGSRSHLLNDLGKETETGVPNRHRPLSDFLSFAAPAHPCALKPAVSVVVMCAWLQREQPGCRHAVPHRNPARSRKPIIETIGCNDHCGTVSFAQQAGIGLK